jgi:hypothetical protein
MKTSLWVRPAVFRSPRRLFLGTLHAPSSLPRHPVMPTHPGRSRYLKPKALSILANLENDSCSGARGFRWAAIIHDGKPICLYKSTYCARPGCQLTRILTAAHRVLRTWKSSRTASLQYLLWGLAQSLSRTHVKFNLTLPRSCFRDARQTRSRPAALSYACSSKSSINTAWRSWVRFASYSHNIHEGKCWHNGLRFCQDELPEDESYFHDLIKEVERVNREADVQTVRPF